MSAIIGGFGSATRSHPQIILLRWRSDFTDAVQSQEPSWEQLLTGEVQPGFDNESQVKTREQMGTVEVALVSFGCHQRLGRFAESPTTRVCRKYQHQLQPVGDGARGFMVM